MTAIEQNYIDLTEQFNNSIIDIDKTDSNVWKSADDYCNGFVTLNTVKSKHNPVRDMTKYEDIDKKERGKPVHLKNKVKEDRAIDHTAYKRAVTVNGQPMSMSKASRLIKVSADFISRTSRKYRSYTIDDFNVRVVYNKKTMYSIQQGNDKPITNLNIHVASKMMGVTKIYAFTASKENKTTREGWRIWKV